MKKTELKAKFRRYSAEEKWQHYFACKKKIRRLKKEKQELKNKGEDYYGKIDYERERTSKQN